MTTTRKNKLLPEFGSSVLSNCKEYRYRLLRKWGDGPMLVWVMLNPSTANAATDDATIRRVRGFTKREGYNGFVVVNVWAVRATSPRDLHERREAFTVENMLYVRSETLDQDVVVAWGGNVANGPGLELVEKALQKAKSVRCLGFTKGPRPGLRGEPRHPLRLRKDTPLVEWSP